METVSGTFSSLLTRPEPSFTEFVHRTFLNLIRSKFDLTETQLHETFLALDIDYAPRTGDRCP